MGILSVTTFVTLDGVMQAPGGRDEHRGGGFDHGGWAVPYFGEDEGRIVTEIFENADAFLLGRRTYEIFASHWPRVTDPADPIAGALNRLPKHVASRTLKELSWQGASLLGGDVAQEVGALKRRYPRELQVHGSAGLLQTLLRHDLVDTLHLMLFPVALGTGIRLFGEGTVPAAFELVSTRSTGAGVVYAAYRRKGKPEYGNMGLETQD